jgi:hypothetical protein
MINELLQPANSMSSTHDPDTLSKSTSPSLERCISISAASAGERGPSYCEVLSAEGNSDVQTELLLGTGDTYGQRQSADRLSLYLQQALEKAPSSTGSSGGRGVAVGVLWMGERLGGGLHGEGDWLIPPGRPPVVPSCGTVLKQYRQCPPVTKFNALMPNWQRTIVQIAIVKLTTWHVVYAADASLLAKIFSTNDRKLTRGITPSVRASCQLHPVYHCHLKTYYLSLFTSPWLY